LKFVCDAPMRAYLKCIKAHSGYQGCERCVDDGDYHGGHVCFLQTDSTLRSDNGFLNKSHADHHTGPISALESVLNFPLVSGFVLDYMHLTCVGVMKRLLKRLQASGKHEPKCHLSTKQRKRLKMQLSSMIIHILLHNRKFQSGLDKLHRWKATEYRLMMLSIHWNHLLSIWWSL